MSLLRWHSITKAIRLVLLICMAIAMPWATSEAQEYNWNEQEALSNRLSAEYSKINVLQSEFIKLEDILRDLRNLQIYPVNILHLSEDQIVAVDKEIEKIEKQYQKQNQNLISMKPELVDGIAILKEMVTGEPVDAMFKVLEEENLQRINNMLRIKNNIASMWRAVDSVLAMVAQFIGVDIIMKDDLLEFEREFLDLIKSNLGRQSEQRYQTLVRIKTEIIKKATSEEMAFIYRVEKHALEQYITEKLYTIALEKTKNMLIFIPESETVIRAEIRLLQAELLLIMENYNQCLQVLESFSVDSMFTTRFMPIYIQALFGSRQFESVISEADKFLLYVNPGVDRNKIIWLVLESKLATKDTTNFVALASSVSQANEYAINVLHALARHYILVNDYQTAESVLLRAISIATVSRSQLEVLDRVRLDLAKLYYQQKQYEVAQDMFYDLLKQKRVFEHALMGIAWCNIQLERYAKAEKTLQTLINQSPASPLAIEGIQLLSKRLIAKVQYEWEKKLYIHEQVTKFHSTLQRLEYSKDSSLSDVQLATIDSSMQKVGKMLDRLNGVPTESIEQLDGLFYSAEKVNQFVVNRYSTGSYQENKFTDKREKILHQLDSVTIQIENNASIQGSRSQNRSPQTIQLVKQKVRESTFEILHIQLLRMYWKKEVYEYKKLLLHEKKQKILKNNNNVHIDSVRIADIDEQINQLLRAEEDTMLIYMDKSMTNIENALQFPLQDEQKSFLYYHLAELYYQFENDRYTRAMDVFDMSRQMVYHQQMSGDSISESAVAPPEITHSRSIELFNRARKTNNQNLYATAALYSIGWCYNDLGKFDSARIYMDSVAMEDPSHPLASSALMYVGEHYFERSEIESAIRAYAAVLDYPESQWFDEALYKLAWTQYRKSNPHKAISSFFALVDLGDATGDGKDGILKRESIDYIAISFSEIDMRGEKGLLLAREFARRIEYKQRGAEILHRLAQVYREQGRYNLSVKTYKELLDFYAGYQKSPQAEAEMIQTQLRADGNSTQVEKKIAVFEKYNKTSTWNKSQKDLRVRAIADSIAQNMLYQVGVFLHQSAIQDRDTTTFTKAKTVYEQFLRIYDDNDIADEVHYNYAELLYAKGELWEAARQYMILTKKYPESKYRETAAWNAIVAAQKIVKQEELSDE